MIKTENKYFIFDRPRIFNAKYIIKSIILFSQTVFYSVLMKFIHPLDNRTTKYKVAVCGMFKDEAPYLKEWIEFHRIVGVEHFYMYNNLSSDNYLEILEPYIEMGIVDLIDWPYPQTQLKAYADCINRFKNETKWLGFIDLDEFVVPIVQDSIYEFLKKFDNKCPSVLINWKLFGSSGKLDRDITRLVTEDFIQCWDKYDEVGKCFFNTAYEFKPGDKKNHVFHHFHWGAYRNILFPPFNSLGKVCVRQNFNLAKKIKHPIQINHYFTKSYTEYTQKRTKGDVFYKNNPHDSDDYFYRHDKLSQSSDYKIFKYMIQLKKSMNLNV